MPGLGGLAGLSGAYSGYNEGVGEEATARAKKYAIDQAQSGDIVAGNTLQALNQFFTQQGQQPGGMLPQGPQSGIMSQGQPGMSPPQPPMQPPQGPPSGMPVDYRPQMGTPNSRVAGQFDRIGGGMPVQPNMQPPQFPGGGPPMPQPRTSMGFPPQGGQPPSMSQQPTGAFPVGPVGGGSPPQGGQQQFTSTSGTLDMRALLQAAIKANPGAKPQDLMAGVSQLLPLMNAQSQQEWRQVMDQYRRSMMGGGMGMGGGADQGMIDAIGTYRQAPLSVSSMRPQNRILMDQVYAKYPDYDANKFYAAQSGARASGAIEGQVTPVRPQEGQQSTGATPMSQKETEIEFSRGQGAKVTTSFNVLVQHLDVLQGAFNALQSGDTPKLNQLRNWWLKNTGSPLPTNVEGIRKIVGDEIVKAVLGAGGGVTDREAIQQDISAAAAPEQINELMARYKQMALGQLHGQEQKYKAGSGREDYQKRFLLPETIKSLKTVDESQGEQGVPTQTYVPGKGWQ